MVIENESAILKNGQADLETATQTVAKSNSMPHTLTSASLELSPSTFSSAQASSAQASLPELAPSAASPRVSVSLPGVSSVAPPVKPSTIILPEHLDEVRSHQGRLRILLVDDDEDDYVLTRDLLGEVEESSVGELVLDWASDYNAGLEAIARNEHDIYLVDYRLGEYDGIELLKYSQEHQCQAPMILFTGQREREIDLAAMHAGAADYLYKGSLTPVLLERSIRYALERARNLDALRESRERYMLALQGANDGLWDWNILQSKFYFSPRWKSMLGWQDHEIHSGGEEWFSRVHPADLGALRRELNAHLKGSSTHFEHEHRILHRDGQYRWTLARGLAVRNHRGQPTRMAGSLSDITARKVAEESLLYNALHDRLTELPNRTLFNDRLGYAIARTKRDLNYQFAVLFLDLDRFKLSTTAWGTWRATPCLFMWRNV
jgi:PAS domain S-box-containing protein